MKDLNTIFIVENGGFIHACKKENLLQIKMFEVKNTFKKITTKVHQPFLVRGPRKKTLGPPASKQMLSCY